MATPAAILNILVTANTGQATAALSATQAQLVKTAGTAKTTSSAIGSRIATGAKVAAGATALIGVASVKAAADFESSFASVRKTVDTNEKGFNRLEKGLRQLAKEIPVSVNELNELAGEAGALGVKEKDLISFTKTAAQLGTSTNLSAEAAANALARVGNIMDTKGQKSFQRMGATLVDLGNKGASTEDEIASMALRIAGAGKTLGLAEQDVFGLAASLANVGIRAEMGGSAISRVMLGMQDAVAVGGEDLEQFARITGVTMDQFAEQFERDAPTAIAKFAQGLGTIVKDGGSVTQTLDEVNLNEIRVRDTLLRIAGNTRDFAKTQDTANKAWKDNSALADEAAKRYKTFDSQIVMLKNSVNDVAISIGQELLPDLKDIVGILRDPKLTFSQKIAEIGSKLGDMFAEWAPKVIEAGAQLAINFGKGFLQAFQEMNPLAKVLSAAALIRVIGGAGALSSIGKRIGVFLGVGIATGAAGGLAGTATAGAGAAAGGAAAGGLMGKIRSIKWGRVGAIGVGIALADQVLGEFTQTTEDTAGDYEKALENTIDIGFFEGLVSDVKSAWEPGGLEGFGPGEPTQLENTADAAERLKGELDTLRETGRKIDLAKLMELRALAEDAGLAGEELDNLKADLKGITEIPPMPSKIFPNIGKLLDVPKGKFDLNIINDVVAQLEELPPAAQKNASMLAVTFARELEQKGELPKGAASDLLGWIEARFGELPGKGPKAVARMVEGMGIEMRDLPKIFRGAMNGSTDAIVRGVRTGEQELGGLANVARNKGEKVGKGISEPIKDGVRKGSHELGQLPKVTDNKTDEAANKGRKNSKKLADDVLRNVDRLVTGVGEGLETNTNNVNKALKGFGVKKATYVAFEAQRANLPGGQKGMVVPGATSGDRHLLSLDGQPMARVESGELISVANRTATSALMKVNDDIRRAPGMQAGGVAGMQPGIMKLVQWAGRTLGLNVSSGLRPGDSDSFHGSGEAADFTPPSMGATRSIFSHWKDQLAELFYDPWGGWNDGQMIGAIGDHMDHIHAAIRGAGGGAVAAFKELKDMTLKGPAGPLREIGQESLNKAVDGANAFLRKQAPTMASEFGPGTLSTGEFLRLANQAIKLTGAQGFSAQGLLTLAMAESGLDPNSQNLWDSNASAGVPSGGLMQVIPPTFHQYHEPGTSNDLFDPLANIAASINYQIARYGGQVTHSPYKYGGIVAALQGGGLAGEVPNVGPLMDILGEPEGRNERLGGWLERLREFNLANDLMADIHELSPLPELFTEFANRANEETREGFPDWVATNNQALYDRSSSAADMASIAQGLDIEGLVSQPALDALREQADIAGERASRASALAQGAPAELAGTTLPLVEGKDELGWLQEQLSALFQLRNRMIEAQGGPFVTLGMAGDMTQPQWLDEQLRILWDYRNQLIESLHDRDRMYERGQYNAGKDFGKETDLGWWEKAMDRLWKLRNRVAEAAELLEKARDKVHDLVREVKHKYNVIGGQINHDENDLEDYKAELEKKSTSDARKKHLREDLIPDLEKKLDRERAVWGILGEKVIPAVEDKERSFDDRHKAMVGRLSDIQGPGGPSKVLNDKKIPWYRSLGGELYEQGRLVEDAKIAKTQSISDTIDGLIGDLATVQGPGLRRVTSMADHTVEVEGQLKHLAPFSDRPTVKGEVAALERDIASVAKEYGDIATSGWETLIDDLRGVQGSGVSMDVLSELPTLGALGGEIFDVQMAIKDKGGVGEAVDTESLLQAQLLAAQQQNIVLTQQMPIFERFASVLPAFGGSFATGGIVPGMMGEPRTVIAHGGEAIGPATDVMVNITVEKGAGVDAGKISYEVDRVIRGDRSRGRRMMGSGR